MVEKKYEILNVSDVLDMMVSHQKHLAAKNEIGSGLGKNILSIYCKTFFNNKYTI